MQNVQNLSELCPHMHLPVQSGSTKVLGLMRRGYSREEYLAIVHRLREIAPEVALTTDLIVGETTGLGQIVLEGAA